MPVNMVMGGSGNLGFHRFARGEPRHGPFTTGRGQGPTRAAPLTWVRPLRATLSLFRSNQEGLYRDLNNSAGPVPSPEPGACGRNSPSTFDTGGLPSPGPTTPES